MELNEMEKRKPSVLGRLKSGHLEHEARQAADLRHLYLPSLHETHNLIFAS